VGDAARFGTEVHAFLERVPQIGVDAALAMVPESDRGFCENLPLDKLPVQPGKFMQEVAFAIDLDSGNAVKVGVAIGRNYPRLFAHQIHGTADVVATAGPRLGYVADYKSGAQSHVPMPAENPQLLTLGYAAAKVFGWDEVILAIHFLREGKVWTKEVKVDVLELDAHLSTLRTLEENIRTMDVTNPAMAEGDWCFWCACFKCCPAKTKLASAIVAGDDSQLTLRLDSQSLPVIWERVSQAQGILDAIKAACQSFAQASPVDLPNGQVFGPHETKQERVTDGAAVWGYLLNRFGSDVAEAATTRHASKDSIAEALRGPLAEAKAAGQATTLAALKRSVLGELREAGAVQDVVTVRVEPHWPPKG